MIKKIADYLLPRTNSQIFHIFSTHKVVPAKLQKVQETTVKFNVKNLNGQWEQINAFVGQSFFQAIVRMKVKSYLLLRQCNGADPTFRPHHRPHDPFFNNRLCGMCRIVLLDNWYDRIFEETDGMTLIQQTIILRFSDFVKGSRLACCIPVQKWMDGCTFEICGVPEVGELRIFR